MLIWLTGILPLGSRKLLYLGEEKKEIGGSPSSSSGISDS